MITTKSVNHATNASGEHPYAEGIETLTVGIFPIDPTWSPGETYAFIVNVNGQTGYAVDAQDAMNLARLMFNDDVPASAR